MLGLPYSVEEKEYPVLEQNWDIVRAFLACQTQWRHGPSGRVTGLEYAAAQAVVLALGLRWRRVFKGLQSMEAEALRLLAIRYP